MSNPRDILPHRDPILLVDRYQITKKGVIGVFSVDPNLSVFEGHFPKNPIFPGVYTLEHEAQVGACMLMEDSENEGKLPLFTSANIEWFGRVMPGDQIETEVFLIDRDDRGRRFKAGAISRVRDKIVAGATLGVAMLKAK